VRTLTTLDLAGWRLQLICQPETLATATAARYAAFAGGAPPDLTLRVTWDSSSPSPADQAHPLAAVTFQATGNEYLFDGPTFRGKINMARAEATFSLRGRAPLEDLEHAVRVLYALLADRHGGLLVHAAGLLYPAGTSRNGGSAGDGRVYLFVGQSGSGKSTVVGLSSHTLALNDDLILLRPKASGWVAYGTPFWNTEAADRRGETASGHLAGIYRLIQDQDVFLEPFETAEAAAELIANCPVVNGDPGRLPGLLERCHMLAKAVPVQRLHFRKDPDFWGLLQR
jgi:hypothetical protein